MKSILYVSSEVSPFSSSGGLGDVIGALPKTLYELDNKLDIRVVSPLYSMVGEKYRSKMKFEKSFNVKVGWRNQYCGVFSMDYENVKWYFIDNEYYFKRDKLYAYYDDGERFSYFSKAVLEMMKQLEFFPDVMHCNDWQTAYSVVLLSKVYSKIEEYKNIKSVFTIHNIQYQGFFGNETLGDIFDIGMDYYCVLDYNHCVNLMKGAVECANKVTTVSPRYSKEIQTEEYSFGLSPILREHSYKLVGLINGIDYDVYNPVTDTIIPYNFSIDDLTGKRKNKKELMKKLGLKHIDYPLISMITRLVEPKGVDLVKDVIDKILQNDVNFVLLGTGDDYYEKYFESLNSKYPGKCKCIISYDRKLAQLIYAGSDIFLMPSKSEACGLAQMIASRYGTVPVVHETGGLYDTIKSYTNSKNGNGFTFVNYNSDELKESIINCLSLYDNTRKWHTLEKKIMQVDFSWKQSANEYLQMYNKI